MKRYFFMAIAMLASICASTSAYALSDKEIKQAIIAESISSYPGNCPCPYNTDRAGHRCGKRSAYSRAGGYAPLCFQDDVTDEMVSAYRVRNERSNNLYQKN